MRMQYMEYFREEPRGRDDLIVLIDHIRQDCERYARFEKEAEQTGDKVLAEFYREVQAQDRLQIWRAEQLLKQRLQ
jgi:hypothetical protein